MSITFNDEKLTGLILASMSNIIPEGFLLCDGSAWSRTIFSSLFSLSPRTSSIITISNPATPCVVTWTSHGLATGQSIQFSTTGSLPTFSTVQTVYFIRVIDTNTFHLYDTLSNSMNTGSTTGRINTSGSQSGIHTGLVYYWGNGDGSTTFNIPDGRGVVLRGSGTSVGYITNPTLTIGSRTDDAIQNITGSTGDIVVGNTTGSGALSNSVTSSAIIQVGGSFNYTNITFDASRMARTTTETRVKSINVRYYIKY